jgi:diaminohydroxyphosphoribosylaminopyrimidine deaminase/5-amino-6-(5-phosphoribosylamino)uracil reductase
MNFMQQAIALAELGRYTVTPNPMVGCIIEKNGQIIGRGYHKRTGEEHAEIIALNEAGHNAKDANIYVTLEPCCHHGRTPPCVDRLIAAQVKSVHIPFIDPNPLVNGKGVKKLRAAGVNVYIGEEAKAVALQNEVFLHHMQTKLPFVVAKWAMTLDGRIAADSGDSKWISAISARKHVHQSRCWLGGVLVGANTVIMDNPQLTPYLLESSTIHPYRIILDGNGTIPLTAKILQQDLTTKTIIATTENSAKAWQQALLNSGAQLLILPTNENGQIDLNNLLTELGKLQITGLLVEGGQTVLTNFFQQKLVNKAHIYIASKLLGGKRHMHPLADLGIASMADAKQLTIEKQLLFDDTIFLEAYPTCSQA